MMRFLPTPPAEPARTELPLTLPHDSTRCDRCTTGSLFLDEDTERGNALPAEWVCLQCGWRRRARRHYLSNAAPAD